MKITDVRVVTKHLVDSSTALVQVDTDEGVTGIGATSASVPVVAALIEAGMSSMRPLLIGQDPTETNRLWHVMYDGWQAQRGRGGEGWVAVNAMGAVDMALWDIAGKARDLPIYKLLGGSVQAQVMAYASTSRMARRTTQGTREQWRRKSPEEMVRGCKEYVEQGFKAIKFGWGNHFGPEGQEALAAIREAIGQDIRLVLDFGCPAYLTGGWNVKDAVKVSTLLEEYDIFFLEEPLRPYDVEGFAALTRESPVKIATGESLTTTREFQRYIENRAVDVVQPDAQQMGITQFYRVALMSQEAGMLCIPHCPWTVMAVAAHLHVLATTSNGIMIEYPGFASFERGSAQHAHVDAMHSKVIETPLVLSEGYLQLPETPGLGLGDFVPEAIAELHSA